MVSGSVGQWVSGSVGRWWCMVKSQAWRRWVGGWGRAAGGGMVASAASIHSTTAAEQPRRRCPSRSPRFVDGRGRLPSAPASAAWRWNEERASPGTRSFRHPRQWPPPAPRSSEQRARPARRRGRKTHLEARRWRWWWWCGRSGAVDAYRMFGEDFPQSASGGSPASGSASTPGSAGQRWWDAPVV